MDLCVCACAQMHLPACQLLLPSVPLQEGIARINDAIYDSNHLPPCRILIICPKTSKLGPTCDPCFFLSYKWHRN